MAQKTPKTVELVLARLGRRIKELRNSQSLSQSDLAEAVGTATETISRIERGVSIPSVQLLVRIAITLNVELQDFFSTNEIKRQKRLSPEVAKIVALVGSKPTRVQRQVLKLVKYFLKK